MDISRRYRKKRRDKYIRIAFLSSASGALFLIFLWWMFSISYFHVTSIEIEGQVDRATVETLFKNTFMGNNMLFLPKANIFLINTTMFEELLEEKEIGIAEVKKKYPSTLTIFFPEYTPFFLWCAPGGVCYYGNERGVLFSQAPNFSESPLPLLILSKASHADMRDFGVGITLFSEDQSKYFAALVRGFQVRPFGIKAIELQEGLTLEDAVIFQEVKVFTQEDWYVFTSAKQEPAHMMDDLLRIIEQKLENQTDTLEYVDLRFSNKAFYKTR